MNPTTLSILTFNIAGLPAPPFAHLRIHTLCQTIEHMPELSLINLQEVHTYGLLWHLRKSLKSFPYVTFAPGAWGPRGGLVTFSKFPLHEKAFFLFSNSHHRGILAAKTADHSLVIINAHLTANTDGDWSKTNRFYNIQRIQLQDLIKHIRNLNTPRVILTGDFNLARGCELQEQFSKECGLHDAFAATTEPTFISKFLPKDRIPQCIDYMYANAASGTCMFIQQQRLFQEAVELGLGYRGFVSNHVALSTMIMFDGSTQKRMP